MEATHNPYTKLVLTGLSAMVAESATFPIDLTKTRLQLHGESSSSSRSTNAFRLASAIVKDQGPFALYKGLSPAILRHLFYTPIRIVGYEHLRSLFLASDGGSVSFHSKALVGGISGSIAQVPIFPHYHFIEALFNDMVHLRYLYLPMNCMISSICANLPNCNMMELIDVIEFFHCFEFCESRMSLKITAII